MKKLCGCEEIILYNLLWVLIYSAGECYHSRSGDFLRFQPRAEVLLLERSVSSNHIPMSSQSVFEHAL